MDIKHINSILKKPENTDDLIIIPFETKKEPIIKITLFNHDVYMLVDCGSEAGILSNKFFDLYAPPELNPFRAYDINGITGNSEQYYDFLIHTLINDVLFADVVYSVGDCDGIMSQYQDFHGIKISGVIGRKFLYDNKFILDFKNHLMYAKI